MRKLGLRENSAEPIVPQEKPYFASIAQHRIHCSAGRDVRLFHRLRLGTWPSSPCKNHQLLWKNWQTWQRSLISIVIKKSSYYRECVYFHINKNRPTRRLCPFTSLIKHLHWVSFPRKQSLQGINIVGHNMNNLRYIDDTVLRQTFRNC